MGGVGAKKPATAADSTAGRSVGGFEGGGEKVEARIAGNEKGCKNILIEDKISKEQDRTIGILEDVRDDTGEIKNALPFLKEIHSEKVESRDKYEALSRDVAAIKGKLKL